MDRRAIFFLGASVVSFALAPFTPSGLGYVGYVLGSTYLVLAVLSAWDHHTRHGRDRRR